MNLTRRSFFNSALAGGLALRMGGAESDSTTARALVTERLMKADLPTPALLVDLDRLEANLKHVADHCRQAGCGFRPHAKTHKCPEIAKRQIAAGASGICVATVSEAEAMVGAGIPGVLLTSPIMDQHKIARMVELVGKRQGVMLSVGHRLEVDLLTAAAGERNLTVDVLIDVDVGDRRTGVLPGEPALELARLIGKSKSLRLRGIQAYSGASTHVVGFFPRQEASRAALAKAVATRKLLANAGFETPIFSGGSTGTYNIDTGTLTELQVGSYVFMDVNYMVIGSKKGNAVYDDFQPSLTVLTTVVSASHSDQVTVDAGIKGFSTDSADRPAAKDWEAISYRRSGDEFGAVTAGPGGKLPKIGDRLEFIVPHCDPTVNLYDRIYAMRGEKVEEVWPIAARREFAAAGRA